MSPRPGDWSVEQGTRIQEPATGNMGPRFVHDFLLCSARRFPNKTAVITASRRISYGDLLGKAEGVSAWLSARGLIFGDRVGLLLDDPADYVASYFGVLMAGGVVVALNTQTSERTLQKLLNDCGMSCLLTDRKFWKYVDPALTAAPCLKRVGVVGGAEGLSEGRAAVESLEGVFRTQSVSPFAAHVSCCDCEGPGSQNSELRPRISERETRSSASCGSRSELFVSSDGSSDSLAQIIYTSGTTGEPKGVMLRHSNLVANTLAIVDYLGLTEDDRVMAVLPFFYSYGNSVLLTHVAAGGSLVVNQSFVYPNVVLDQMVAEEVTGFSGVPSTYALLLHRSAIRNYQFPALRYVTQAGGAMTPRLAREVQESLPGTEVFIMYGQTEASARLSYLPPKDLLRKAGSVGKAIPGVTLEVLDASGAPAKPGEVGEIVARGPNVMAGYWGQPEATSQVLKDGALWTGDLATVDDEGYLTIVSRKSELIKSGAHRISPKEIEEILQEHPGVHEVAVIGVPDEILGEAVKAVAVLKSGAVCTERDLLLHCRRNLPAYKVPQRIAFCEDLPKTETGKVRKSELR